MYGAVGDECSIRGSSSSRYGTDIGGEANAKVECSLASGTNAAETDPFNRF